MSERKNRLFYGYVIVLASFFIMLMSNGTRYCFGVFFIPMSNDFGWDRATTSLAFSMSMLFIGLMGIIIGRLSDRFGSRIVVTIGGLFFGLGYLLLSQINSLWQLYLVYGVIIGIGSSGFWVPILSTIARWFSRRRGIITAISLTGMGVGTMIMPPLANWLITSYNWRISFMVLGISTLVIITLAAQFLRRDPSKMELSPYGETSEGKQNNYSRVTDLNFKQAVRTYQFWLLLLMNYCYGFGFQALWVHMVPHAISLNITPANAATILTVMGGTGIAGRLVMGRLGDRIGYKRTFILCLSMHTVALIWLLVADSLWKLFIFGIVYSFATPALLSPTIAQIFGLSSHGVILGAIGMGWTIAGTTSPVIAGLLYDINDNYRLAFLIAAILSAIGVLLISFLRPISGNENIVQP